jgi:hypothetical protein
MLSAGALLRPFPQFEGHKWSVKKAQGHAGLLIIPIVALSFQQAFDDRPSQAPYVPIFFLLRFPSHQFR